MTRWFPGRSARFAVLSTLALVLFSVAFVGVELVNRYYWAHETLQSIEPRFARIQGLEFAGDEIFARRDKVRSSLLRYAYPPDIEPGAVGTALQQRIRQLAEQSGMRVDGSQIMPVRPGEGYQVFSVTAMIEGQIEALSMLIDGLAQESPSVFVEQLTVIGPRAGRRGEVNTRVSVQLQVAVVGIRS